MPLTDAMGSVLALSDSSGNLVTQYSYDPFGNTTGSGAASGNPSQYIGSENDGNGLYFMKARYYSPALHRFISEDPIGYAVRSINLHVYSLNSPTNLKDPNGTCAVAALTSSKIYNGSVIINNPVGPEGRLLLRLERSGTPPVGQCQSCRHCMYRRWATLFSD